MHEMDILAALDRRYATKKFLPEQKVTDQDLHDLLEVVRLAPTAYGLQPFRLTVISDDETKQKLRSFSEDKPQITQAPHLLVFSIVKELSSSYFEEYLNIVSELRNIPVDTLFLYKKTIQESILNNPQGESITEWALSRAHIALGFLLLAAAQMGIDACAIESIDIPAYNKILDLDDQGLSAVFVCAIGHRNPDDPNAHFKKIRRPFDQMVSFFSPEDINKSNIFA